MVWCGTSLRYFSLFKDCPKPSIATVTGPAEVSCSGLSPCAVGTQGNICLNSAQVLPWKLQWVDRTNQFVFVIFKSRCTVIKLEELISLLNTFQTIVKKRKHFIQLKQKSHEYHVSCFFGGGFCLFISDWTSPQMLCLHDWGCCWRV